VIRAQALDEPVAWIEPEDGSLFPPDLADAGIDLDALIVIRVPRAAGPRGLARAAELLLRSGAFGLVVVDLEAQRPRGEAWLGRLSALCREHDSRVVMLSEQADERPSLGAMVGLRVSPRRERRGPGRFLIAHRVLRDKAGGGPLRAEPRSAPAGLS
jgi:recombination protein RecA